MCAAPLREPFSLTMQKKDAKERRKRKKRRKKEEGERRILELYGIAISTMPMTMPALRTTLMMLRGREKKGGKSGGIGRGRKKEGVGGRAGICHIFTLIYSSIYTTHLLFSLHPFKEGGGRGKGKKKRGRGRVRRPTISTRLFKILLLRSNLLPRKEREEKKKKKAGGGRTALAAPISVTHFFDFAAEGEEKGGRRKRKERGG